MCIRDRLLRMTSAWAVPTVMHVKAMSEQKRMGWGEGLRLRLISGRASISHHPHDGAFAGPWPGRQPILGRLSASIRDPRVVAEARGCRALKRQSDLAANSMNVSSRTPEGKRHTCAHCGHEFRISPSLAGDACCPICNTSIWPSGRDESDDAARQRRHERHAKRRLREAKQARRRRSG